MEITQFKLDRGSVYAEFILSSADICASGTPQGAVKAAIDEMASAKGIPSLIYTRVTAMEERPDDALFIRMEGAIPPEVILGPYIGVTVDIGHCEDFEEAAIQAAAKNIRVVLPELMVQRKIDSLLLDQERGLLESLSLNTLADIRAIILDLNDTLSLNLDDESVWAKAMKAAENYIGMGMQDIGAFTQAFDGVLDVDGESIVRAAERRAYARGGLSAESVADDVFEGWLKTENKTRDQWREEQREQAELMCRIDLMLAAVADEEKFDATQEELEQAVNTFATQYQMRPDEIIATVGLESIRYQIRISKATQCIAENAVSK